MLTVCSSCAFFEPTGPDIGECRRNAPRPALVMVQALCDHPDNVTAWPTVFLNNWCGEWEPATLPAPPIQPPNAPAIPDHRLTYNETPDTGEEGL